jgi:predicted MFS family arabinose efflux permease
MNNVVGLTPLSRQREIALVGALSLAAFLAALNGQFFAPVTPQVADDLGVSVGAVGQLVTVGAFAGAALSLIAGPLTDVIGRRRAISGGLAIVIVAALGSAVAPSFAMLLGLRLLAGVGMALLGPATVAAVADFIPPERQPQAMGWVIGASSAAILIGWPAITQLTAWASWRLAFVGIAGLAILVAALALLTLPRAAERPAPRVGLGGYLQRYGAVLADRRVVFGVLASGLAAASWFGVTTYSGAFFQKGLGISLADQRPIFTGIGIAYYLASVAGGMLAARIGVRTVALLSGLGSTLLLVAYLMLPLPLLGAVGCVIGLAGFRSGGLTSLSSLLVALRPAERGSVAGLNNLTFSLGISLGAGLGGFALDMGGFPALGGSLAALAGLATVLLALLPEPKSSAHRM